MSLSRLLPTVLVLLIGPASEKRPKEPLPPLPWNYQETIRPAGHLGQKAKGPELKVVIGWQNAFSPWASNYLTGLETSSDLSTWKTVREVPYTTNVSIALTNAEEKVFIRAYNKLKL